VAITRAGGSVLRRIHREDAKDLAKNPFGSLRLRVFVVKAGCG